MKKLAIIASAALLLTPVLSANEQETVAIVQLQMRVKALESKIDEMNSALTVLDNRITELEMAVKQRFDGPDKFRIYREVDAVLDQLIDDTKPSASPGGFTLVGFDPESPDARPNPVKIELPLPKSELALGLLCDAVEKLSSKAAPDAQQQAIATLQDSGDQGLAVLVKYGLYHTSPKVRARSAELLGNLGRQRVLRELIEAFYASAQPTVPPYQREYVKVLRDQISSLTGQDFFFYIRRTSRAHDVALEMVNWWEQHWQSVVPQLGEPKLDMTSPYYVQDLRTLRTLKLEERNFGDANYPPDADVAPGEVTRDVDQPFKKTIPMIPRDAVGSRPTETRSDAQAIRDENSRQRNRVP